MRRWPEQIVRRAIQNERGTGDLGVGQALLSNACSFDPVPFGGPLRPEGRNIADHA